MHFNKLRVAGFKSFVDPVELQIERGMTGVVGPNGCGKSNVVEALRWVMGETSAKSMRGDGMDDVIFNGTTSRPARNIAEVVLYIDNADRKAPAMFNDADELEISRRIERDSGSTYRVNGREFLARDIQLLFADLATGAHSTALVSQGRITAMIGAKPLERRALLEEAAGIKGLHTRRHEAELRLRAAESNMERLEDVIAALEGQHQGLQRQARQAARYRRLSGQIRRFDAILLHLTWTEATQAAEAAEAALAEARSVVAERTAAAAAAATVQADAAAALPPQRKAEVEAAAALQHLQLARREMENEAERIATAQTQLEQRLQQIAGDLERESTLDTDAAEAVERLEAEHEALGAAQAGEATQREEAAGALAESTRDVEAREAALQEATGNLAETDARRESLTLRLSELAERIARLTARHEELESERAAHAAAMGEDVASKAAAKEVEAAEGKAESAQAAHEAAETVRADAEEREAEARDGAQAAQAAMAKMVAEEGALAELLEAQEEDLFPPVIDAVTVDAGYETALGAALGEDLYAPTDGSAPVHWVRRTPIGMSPLPGNARSLARFVEAPAELTRRLAAVGVIEDSAAGPILAEHLTVGQRLVSLDGGLWRWDGFTVAAGAPTAVAKRLAQRNRLAEIRATLSNAEKESGGAGAALEAAQAEREAAVATERETREAARAGFAALNAAREDHTRLTNERITRETRLSSLIEALEAAQADRGDAERDHAATETGLSGLGDIEKMRKSAAALRAALGEARIAGADRRSAHDRLVADAERRGERLRAIEAETETWRQRATGAAARLADMNERRGAAETERDALAKRPAEIEQMQTALMDQIENAETARGKAGDALAAGETALAEADRALKSCEAAQAEARENLVRAESQTEQGARERAGVAERVREKLDVAPDRILAATDIEETEVLPEREAAATRLDRLVHERDGMGPVNLRAEQEAGELREQVDTLHAEREDLLAAIARLRQGIGALNREGRERLMAAFKQVNGHFEDLFTRLFGGGRAHLALTEADDPLDAGLEIMASPPGKKLTTMSLLSGGEQALAAVALLFAVFLTNPAPICVLDEVDAPLDDSNVDRFCSLVGDLSHSGDTRFLLVTHHRMTMARMDRLFGVTMGEAGVSQIVSVDLARAEEAVLETA